MQLYVAVWYLKYTAVATNVGESKLKELNLDRLKRGYCEMYLRRK